MNKRIMIDPSVLVGKPVVRGTRMSVEFVVGLLAQGWSADDVLKEYDTSLAKTSRHVLPTRISC